MQNTNIDNSKNNFNADNLLELLKTKINSIINHSYEETIRQFKNINDLNNWKNQFIELINKEIDKIESNLKLLINNLNQKENIKSEGQNEKEKSKILNQNNQLISDNSNKKSNQNIEQNKPLSQTTSLDIFTIKDIKEENKEITGKFLKEAFNYIDDDEVIENEVIAKFLIKVANVSRRAYNNSNDLFIKMFKEFSKFKSVDNNISALKKNEQLRKEFSSWVKHNEKGPQGKQKYEYFFRSFKDKEKYAKEDYISKLLSQLTILYFHCELSFPIVNVDFYLKSDEPYNPEKMIDIINKGNNRKVNFVILPSLFSKGEYLENGKFWVFTYNKNTFRFDNHSLKFEFLVYKQEKDN